MLIQTFAFYFAAFTFVSLLSLCFVSVLHVHVHVQMYAYNGNGLFGKRKIKVFGHFCPILYQESKEMRRKKNHHIRSVISLVKFSLILY